MIKEFFIPMTSKAELENLLSVINGDDSGFENIQNGEYRVIESSEYFDLTKGDIYEFCEERAGGVILKKK